MNKREQYIQPDNSYYKPSRDPNEGTLKLVVVMTALFVILTAVLAVVYFNRSNIEETLVTGDATGESGFISVATPTPSPIPPITDYQNPILYPENASINTYTEDPVVSECDPAARGITEQVAVAGVIAESDYSRETPIWFNDPVYYGQAKGIFTYRGNNFRNCASFGYTELINGELTQVWEYDGIGTMLASTMNFEWSGLRWTGQPLCIKWSDGMRSVMNMYDNAKQQMGLVEVIIAALDGNIYFFNLQTGDMTRDPIYVGSSLKGTPALDPRGYPLLYVGQTDNNGDNTTFGFYIYSLIDGSRLYSYDGSADGAYRNNWNAFDSSPIIDGATDTLIWPCENGMIYTFDLNTNYTPESSTISIAPVCTSYKYIFADNTSNHMGVESSIACYGNYGYFMDNTMNLCCLDLNTMEMVWTKVLGDDSDVTPVIDEEDGIPYVYIGTEVDNQGGTGEYSGAAYVYKINGLTGETVWQTSEPCYTYNGETSETDQSGGCLGNPIIGKNSISNLVIFSFSMTKGLASGNKLVAYDKDLGTVVWEYNMNIYSYSSPVDFYDEKGNAYIIICDALGQIHMIDASANNALSNDERRITVFQTVRHAGKPEESTSGICIEASPIVYEGMIVVGSTSGSIFGIAIS